MENLNVQKDPFSEGLTGLSTPISIVHADYDPMAAVNVQAAKFSEGIGRIAAKADQAGAYKDSKGWL